MPPPVVEAPSISQEATDALNLLVDKKDVEELAKSEVNQMLEMTRKMLSYTYMKKVSTLKIPRGPVLYSYVILL